jgi:hypothetical protein
VAAARQETASLLAHVRTALPGFTVQAEASEKRLEGALGEATGAWTAAQGEIDAGERALEAAGGQVQTECTDLLKVLADAGVKLEQATSEGATVVGRVVAAANDGIGSLSTAYGLVTAGVATLKARLAQTRESLTEAEEKLTERVQVFLDNARFDTNTILDHLMHRQDQYTDRLEHLADDLESETKDLMFTLDRGLRDEAAPALAAAGENFRLGAEGMAAAAVTQQEALAAAREGFDEAVGSLKEAASRLPEGMEEIHDAVLRMRQQ